MEKLEGSKRKLLRRDKRVILNCPVCGKEVSVQDFKKTYVSDWNKKEYKLYHCSGCDLEWWEL